MSSVYCSHHLAAPSQDVLTLMQASEEERKSVNHLIAQHTFNIAPNGYTSSSKKKTLRYKQCFVGQVQMTSEDEAQSINVTDNHAYTGVPKRKYTCTDVDSFH